MIRYRLVCRFGHGFESWFARAAAFDALRDSNQIECPQCGCTEVEKAPMAPRIATGTAVAARPANETVPEPKAPAAPADVSAGHDVREAAARTALARLRRFVESRTEDVGRRFAEEARAIHDGEAPERPIRGEATLADAQALREDGIDALPLPFPARKPLN
jgi:hypothetical protein